MHLLYMLLVMASNAFGLTPPAVSPPIVVKERNTTDAAVIIGNEAYSKHPQVIYAINDAVAVKGFFAKTMNISKSRVKYRENASKRQMLGDVKRMLRKVRKNGTLWVYFSGHGYTNEEGDRSLLPVNAKMGKEQELAISIDEIIALAKKRKKVKRIVLILDAGFGNIGRDGLDIYGEQKTKTPNLLPYSDSNVIVWLPNQGTTASPIFPAAQHGLFTYLFLGSMRGWADGELTGVADQVVTLGEAQFYVANKMVQLGLPLKPTVHTMEEAQDWIIRQKNMVAPPTTDALKILSTKLRAERFTEMSKYIRAKASSMWKTAAYEAQQGGGDGEQAILEFLQEFEYASITLEWTMYIPEVVEAKRMLRTFQREGNIGTFELTDCENTDELENSASVGGLSANEIACLESQIRLNRLQTSRSNMSQILIVNARTKKDMKKWEKLMRRHLERFDRSDPNITFGFAVHLYKKGFEHFNEALKWADYAMENRQMWQGGQDYISKSLQLYRLRAQIATELWIENEKTYRKNRSPELETIAIESRGYAKDYAREWLEYARATETDTTKAFNLCVSAAGSATLCQ